MSQENRLKIDHPLILSRQMILTLLIAAVLTLGPSGCGLASPDNPTQTPWIVTAIPSLTSTGPATATLPSSIEPTASPLPETPTFTLEPSTSIPPTLPAATSCGPLAGWVLYVVQVNDTLFSLATRTNTTVQQVKQANCLISDKILVGQGLYLPFIPSPSPVSTTPPPPIATDTPEPIVTDTPEPAVTETPGCTSVFSCENGDLPPVELDPGGPNDPNFKPCAIQKGHPWISVETENLLSNDLEHGQRAYYFACEFSEPDMLTAQMTGPGGVQTLDVLFSMPNPDLKTGTAQRVVPWNATCDLPTGEYTLTLEDGQGDSAEPLAFTLKSARFERILTIPQSGTPGITFQVYYCGYGTRAGQEVVIDFYHEAARYENGRYDFEHSGEWTVMIDADGWAQQELSSLPGDPNRSYVLNDRDGALEGWDQLWLIH